MFLDSRPSHGLRDGHSARHPRAPRPALRALFALLTLTLSAPPDAAAQTTSYSGAWLASSLRVRYSLQSWGPDCGPRPGADSRPGGGVTISSEGSHLRFAGAMSGSTSGCWSDNAEVRRISASAQEGSWSSRCATPAGNPRGESGRYAYSARDVNTIVYSERTTYNWQLRESTCTATRSANRTLTRMNPLSVPSELPEEAPLPEAPSTRHEPAACVAGQPSALSVRAPSEPLEPGERTCLSVRASDAEGCVLTNPRVDWRVSGPEGASGRMEGRCFTTSANAAEAEGTYRVQATLGSLQDRVEIEVRSPDLSGLIAAREREPEAETPALTAAQSQRAAGVAAVTPRSRGGWRWGLLGAALLLLLGSVFLLVRVVRARGTSRGRRDAKQDAKRDTKRDAKSEERSSEPDDPLKNSGLEMIPKTAPLPPGATEAAAAARASAPVAQAPLTPRKKRAMAATLVEVAPAPHAPAAQPAVVAAGSAAAGETLYCPVCGASGTGAERFCAKHGQPLVSAASNPIRAGGMICPTCRRGYPPDAEFCPHDRATLTPYSIFSKAGAQTQGTSKACPVCGERYAANVTFCGKDGSSLVDAP